MLEALISRVGPIILPAMVLIGCATIGDVSPVLSTAHTSHPIDVRIIAAPETGSEGGLVGATWALALLTAALCWITWRAARSTLRDATRLRRELIEREVNAAAHKAAATAEHARQLAAHVPQRSVQLLALSSPPRTPLPHDIIVVVAQEREARTEEIKQHALDLVFADIRSMTDAALGHAQRRLDAHLVNLEVLKEAIQGELAALDRQIDSAEREATALREQRRVAAIRIAAEVGQCNKLIFVLGQMLTGLEDIQEQLFAARKKELGREPEWNEIGALVGGPARSPGFIVGEYAFILQDDPPVEQAPEVLARIYTAEANFQQTLGRLEERSRLWHEFNERRAIGTLARGEEALREMGAVQALVARLKELTTWLEEDLTECIPAFRVLFPALHRVLEAKYPGRRFIRFWPKDDPSAPPL